MLVILLYSTFSFYFAMQSVSPVIPDIMREFGISHADAGLLMLCVALPAIFLSIPVGVLTVRWGPRRVGGSGMILATAGVLTSYLSSSFALLLAGRLVLGVGGICVIISGYSGMSHWFAKQEMGRVLGVFTLNMPLAIIIALNAIPGVASGFGWRASFLIATVVLISSCLLYLLLVRDNVPKRQTAGMLSGIRNRQAWLVGAVWCLYVTASLSYVTWAGTFFIELKNIPSGLAFFLASMMMIASIPMSPLTGFLSDRFCRRKIFLLVATLGMSVLFLLIPGSSMPVLLLPVILLAVTSALLPSIIYCLPAEVMSPGMAGMGYGILYTCWATATSVGPVLVGYVRDNFAGELPMYAVMAAFAFAAFILASRLKTR